MKEKKTEAARSAALERKFDNSNSNGKESSCFNPRFVNKYKSSSDVIYTLNNIGFLAVIKV